MGDSPDIFGDTPQPQEDDRVSAAELEQAGQAALFGAPEPAQASAPPSPQAPVAQVGPKPSTSAAQPYRVLARKYRPQTFGELIGQQPVVQTLANAIRRDRLAHAFLMTGVRGVGKTTTARLIAKALNCIGPDGQGGPTIDPCGVCEPCVAIAEGRHIDVIEMDAASHTGVDDVREIIEAVRYSAVSARYKIYIIDEVHMLSRNAFNALLKTLEEPPPHVKFLFATTEVDKLPVTVLSRCQRFDLRRITAPMLADHFSGICVREGVEAEAEALSMIAAAAEGSVRDGLSILDQAIAHADLDGDGRVTAEKVREMLGLADKTVRRRLLAALLGGDAKEVLALIDQLFSLGVEPIGMMRAVMGIVHQVTLAQVSGHCLDAASTEECEAVEGWAKRLGAGQLHRLWQLLLKGHEEVRAAPDPLIAVQMALLRVLHAADLPDPAKLAKQLEELGARPPAAPAQSATAVTGGHVAELAPADWETLVGQVESSGALRVAQIMRDWVRVVRIGSDALEFSLVPGYAGEPPATEIRDALSRLRGIRWNVQQVVDTGSPSLRERDEALRAADEAFVREAPVVRAALSAFPDAELIDEDAGDNLTSGKRAWRGRS